MFVGRLFGAGRARRRRAPWSPVASGSRRDSAPVRTEPSIMRGRWPASVSSIRPMALYRGVSRESDTTGYGPIDRRSVSTWVSGAR